MRRILAVTAFLLLPSLVQGQNTGTGLAPFGSFSSFGFDTVNNQNLNVLFSIPLISSAGRGVPLNINLTYNSLVYQNYQGIWLPAITGGNNWWMGWSTIGAGYVSYIGQTTSTKCGINRGTQTTYSNYTFTDVLGTVHPFPSISIVYFCGSSWSGTMTGTASDDSGYYLDASTLHPGAKVTMPNGAATVDASHSLVDTNGNYISSTVVSSTETDWTDSVGNVAAKIIYTPNSTAPTMVQFEFLDGSGNYQTITAKYQAYSIHTNFGCAVTEYSATAYLPYELDIPSPSGATLKYTFSYEQTPGLSGYYTGRLQRITLPTGGYYEYDYLGSNDGINCSDGTTLSLNRSVSDGTNSATWSFVRNTSNSKTTETTPALPDTPNGNAILYTFGSAGQEVERDIYPTTTTSGTPLRTISTAWASNGTPSDVGVYLEDGQTNSSVNTVYDSNGLLDSETVRDWNGSVIRTVTYTYNTSSNYTSRNILNLVTAKAITDGSGTVQYRQDTSYDDFQITNCPSSIPQHDDADYACTMNYRGNPTTVTTYLQPGTPSGGISKTFTYDVFGNLLTAQLNCCQQKTWNFSGATEYSQPDSVVSGSSPTLTNGFTYDIYTGQVATSTDPNNQTTQYAYDFLRRPTSIVRPDTSTISYAYDDVNFKTTETTPIDANNSIQHITQLNGLGRPVTSITEDASNNIYSQVSTNFDLAGRAYATSNPYAGSPTNWTTATFDVLGRPVQVMLPDNSKAAYSYSTNTTTATDPTGKQRKIVMDAAGRLSAVYEPDPNNNNSLTQETSYTYTVLDKLATATHGSQTRTYGYDALGRLASSAVPETAGVATSFTYDNFDNVLTRTDPRGVVTNYSYDGLNRLTGTTYTIPQGSGVAATSNVSYAYGTNAPQFNNGRLVTMTDGVGSENYTYNNMGEMTQLQKVISGTSYTIGYQYNYAGETTQVTYPSGHQVTPAYDAIGRMASITGNLGGINTTYASGFTYSVAEQVAQFQYGNGIYGSFGFSPDRLQLTCLDYSKTNRNGTCTHDDTTIFGLDYGYSQNSGNNGQVTTITDRADNGRSVSYTYDALARLVAATTVGSANYSQWGLSWAYDPYGNRTDQTVTAGTAPSNSVNVSPSTNWITSPGYGYDANGNITNDGQNTLVYDAENRVTGSSGTLGSGSYGYDGNGLRVEKTSSGSTTVYVYSGGKAIAEYPVGSTSPSVEYVYLGTKLLAGVSNGPK